jgi:hypothetical protein
VVKLMISCAVFVVRFGDLNADVVEGLARVCDLHAWEGGHFGLTHTPTHTHTHTHTHPHTNTHTFWQLPHWTELCIFPVNSSDTMLWSAANHHVIQCTLQTYACLPCHLPKNKIESHHKTETNPSLLGWAAPCPCGSCREGTG